MSEFQITFREPSYLMYGDESGKTSATAIFRFGGSPDTKSVPLSTNTFIQVGGLPIGGPELIAVEISGSLTAKIIPYKDFAADANSWSILQFLSIGPERIFNLQVFTNGETQVVPFKFSHPLEPSAVLEPCLLLDDGAIYNDLDFGLLNVDYIIPGSQELHTPIVGKGKDTGGVFSGTVLSVNISSVEAGAQWMPEKLVSTSKGLPVLVFGDPRAPKLAVFRPSGSPDLVKLVPFKKPE
jgi:hypothetical protein